VSEIKRFLAFDVGCIECGESSGVIGTFDSQQEAQAAADEAERIQAAHWHGQHYMEVYDLLTNEPADELEVTQ
jgi:hypothetical protein